MLSLMSWSLTIPLQILHSHHGHLTPAIKCLIQTLQMCANRLLTMLNMAGVRRVACTSEELVSAGPLRVLLGLWVGRRFVACFHGIIILISGTRKLVSKIIYIYSYTTILIDLYSSEFPAHFSPFLPDLPSILQHTLISIESTDSSHHTAHPLGTLHQCYHLFSGHSSSGSDQQHSHSTCITYALWTGWNISSLHSSAEKTPTPSFQLQHQHQCRSCFWHLQFLFGFLPLRNLLTYQELSTHIGVNDSLTRHSLNHQKYTQSSRSWWTLISCLDFWMCMCILNGRFSLFCLSCHLLSSQV